MRVDYRVAAELCTPAMARQMVAVESLVKSVKSSFFNVEHRGVRHSMPTASIGTWGDVPPRKRRD